MKIERDFGKLLPFKTTIFSSSMIHLRVIYNSSGSTKENHGSTKDYHGRDGGLVIFSLLEIISTVQFSRFFPEFFVFILKKKKK